MASAPTPIPTCSRCPATAAAEREKREDRWHRSNADIATALATVDWDELARATDITDSDAQLWHRIRLHQSNLWKRPQADPACRRHGCSTERTETTAHIYWECTAAQHLWKRLTTLWGAQHQPPAEICRAVFTKTAPASHFDWGHQIRAPTTTETDRLLQWLQRAWTLFVICACTRLRHCSIDESGRDDPDEDYHVVVHQWRLRMLSLGSTAPAQSEPDPPVDIAISRMLLTMATRETPPPRIEIRRTSYLLFFDGGSRGNPGPVWAASVSLAAHTTTNNLAEYQGLCHGLTAAEHHKWVPLEVIGDSQMIIMQMLNRHRPKAARLRPLYKTARSTADRLHIRHWHHHYRRHNKMADKAANQAMDTRTSYQAEASYGRPELEELRVWMHNDFHQWTESAEPRTLVPARHSQLRPPAGGQGRTPRPGTPPEHRSTEE